MLQLIDWNFQADEDKCRYLSKDHVCHQTEGAAGGNTGDFFSQRALERYSFTEETPFNCHSYTTKTSLYWVIPEYQGHDLRPAFINTLIHLTWLPWTWRSKPWRTAITLPFWGPVYSLPLSLQGPACLSPSPHVTLRCVTRKQPLRSLDAPILLLVWHRLK